MKGRVWAFGDDIDTDQIFPGKYLPLTDPSEMALHAMEGVPGKEGFAAAAKPGDIVVAGRNFGCGSSREHAPLALKELGIALVIARSFARIFYRNSVNVALPVLECDSAADFSAGDVVEVDLREGTVKNLRNLKIHRCSPLSGLELDILEAGGLIEYLRKEHHDSRRD